MSMEGVAAGAAEKHHSILRTTKATIRFGGLCAVNELDIDVRQGEIYGLIGPMALGKLRSSICSPASMSQPQVRFISKINALTACVRMKSPAAAFPELSKIFGSSPA